MGYKRNKEDKKRKYEKTKYGTKKKTFKKKSNKGQLKRYMEDPDFLIGNNE